MKKGFLFGLGVFFAGSILAASISTISIENKTAGDTVTNDEFNLITQGVGDVTATFDGVVSDETSIDFPKKLKSAELCIGEDCIARWPEPTTPGTSITGRECPSGKFFKKVTSTGIFTCGTPENSGGGSSGGDGVADQSCDSGKFVKGISSGNFTCEEVPAGGGGVTDVCPGGEVMNGLNNGQIECVADQGGSSGGGGSADNLGNHTATATLTTKNILPDGHLTRDIGSSSKWFKNLYVEDINMGGNTLRMNGADIMKNNNSSLEFNAPQNEEMKIFTKGTGRMKINSSANLNMEIVSGTGKLLKIKNNSNGGDIEIATGTGSSNVSIQSPVIKMGKDYPTTKIGVNYGVSSAPAYDLDVNGDINFTGTLYQNGVPFSSGTSGGGSISNQACTSGKVVKGINNGVFSCTNASSSTSPWTFYTPEIGVIAPPAIYTALNNEQVGIGINAPSEKLEVQGGNIKISANNGSGGKLIAEGTITVGAQMCPNLNAPCSTTGEISNCGDGTVRVCDIAGGKWMPISSADGTVVGYTSDSCNSTKKGVMRFVAGSSTESLQICMKNTGSSSYAWRTIMSGGGTSVQ